MTHKPIFAAGLILALATMACSLTVNIPVDQITTGPTQSEEINVTAPDVKTANIKLSFGAGKLSVAAGAEGALITCTATYNVQDFKPKVTVNSDQISLATGDLHINGVPKFGGDVKNEWALKLGDMPMNLTINAGAYQGDYELGDLSLKSLDISDGASDVRLRFSKPNKVEMDTLHYATGASSVQLKGLAYANFTSMIFRSGAGDYTLDFSGELKRAAVVTVESGISQVVIAVPKGMAATVHFSGGLANVNASGDWKRSGNQYTLSSNGPTLTINVNMGAGNLELKALD